MSAPCDMCNSVLTILANGQCPKCKTEFCKNCKFYIKGEFAGKCKKTNRYTTNNHWCREYLNET